MRQLRDYQIESLAKAAEKLKTHTSTLLVLPTGMGKTVVFARAVAECNGNSLVLAHRTELLEQAADKLAYDLGYRPVIEQATRGHDTDLMWSGGNCVVGSVQSMCRDWRLEKFKNNPFDLIIIDEAHHATAASYRKIVEYFLKLNPKCKVLMVTAWPRRGDETALGLVCESVAYEMYIGDGIDLGWLVPIEQEFVIVDTVDFSSLSSRKNTIGEMDFAQGELEAILTQEEALHAMAKPILDKGEKQALVFTAGVDHAHMLASILNRYRERSAAAVDGKTPRDQRAQIVNDFQHGRINYLVNFGVFTEGFDCPSTDLVVMGRPTKSVGMYIQMLGRGTRTLSGVVDGIATPDERKAAIAASAKPKMLAMDFVGNSKHKLVSGVDVLGGNYDAIVRDIAADNIKGQGGNADIMDALRKAKIEHDLMSEEEQRRRRHVIPMVDYRSEHVDPFGYGAAPVAPSVKRGGASDSQVAFLVNLGISKGAAMGFRKGQAGAVIDKLREQRCTIKQANFLKWKGFNPADFNVDTASKKIEELKKRTG